MTPTLTRFCSEGRPELREVKCFAQGHKEAAERKLFLCATGTALSFPKGNGRSRREKVQSCGRKPGPPRRVAEVTRSARARIERRLRARRPGSGRVCAGRVWKGQAWVGVNKPLPSPRAPPVASGGATRRVGTNGARRGAGARDPSGCLCPAKAPGARRPGGEGASGAPAPGQARGSLHSPAAHGIPAPGLRFAGHPAPRCPPPGPPTRSEVQILAAPGSVPRTSSDPPSSRPPDFL